MCECRYNLFELLQWLLIVYYKDQFACYFEPALLQRLTTVSVSWHSALEKTSRLWRSQQEHALLSVYPSVWRLQSSHACWMSPELWRALRRFLASTCRHEVWGWALARGNLNIWAGSPCKGPPPIFWGLSCEHPWALARDFTVRVYAHLHSDTEIWEETVILSLYM